MITEAIKLSNQLAAVVPLLAGSSDRKDYDEALELVEYLVEHEPDNPLVDMLCAKIEHYEDNAAELADFNARQKDIAAGPGVLRTLIDQHSLTLSDFENEIGKKSLVSRILKGERQLTITHIRALCKRFRISPSFFIDVQ